jgi:SMI1 / KNR4 family (SUKH-1)
MKINLNGGGSATNEACQALEGALGCKLSDSFRDFLRSNDGAKPECNIFRISDKNECGVNRFIPVSEILAERTHIENISNKAYPVAWAECGNYIIIDEDKNGAVFFWDHEVPEGIVEIASSFGAFLELLKPFKIKEFELKPDQVKRVWVDPEFLKRLKK